MKMESRGVRIALWDTCARFAILRGVAGVLCINVNAMHSIQYTAEMEIVCYSEYSHNHICHIGLQRASVYSFERISVVYYPAWFILQHIFCENHEVVNEKNESL